MNQTTRFLFPQKFLPFLITVLILLLFGKTFFYRPTVSLDQTTQTIVPWLLETGNGSYPVSLPISFDHLNPRTPLSLTTRIQPKAGDYIYFKSVYAPLRVYIDGILIYEYGYEGSYPAFLLDPPTKTALLPLPETDKTFTLKMEYLSPSQRSTVTLHPVQIGACSAILTNLFSEMGFSLFGSVILIGLGLLLFLIAFVIIRFEESGAAFFWLGLFSFLTGLWVLGECNLTGLFIPFPSLLYLMAFLGLFALPIPLLKFGLIIITFHHARPLQTVCSGLELSLSLALFLQLTGIMALSRSMYAFHFLVPGAFCFFAVSIFMEYLRFQNPSARLFFIPVAVITGSAFLEVLNYYLPYFHMQKASFLLSGVILFILIVSVLCGYFVKDMFFAKEQNKKLAQEISLLDKQILAQQERFSLLATTESQIRQQRHDLRHQLAVIQSYSDKGDLHLLSAYLQQLYSNIPSSRWERLCDNDSVNAIAAHYLSAAEKNGINSLSVQLDVPAKAGIIRDIDLCIIIGNLLENAIAACSGTDEPFIRIQSRQIYDILTITMDNRCSHLNKNPDGTFRSSKEQGGIGLVSVQAVAEKYRGSVKYEEKDGVFFSSVYLHLS